MKKLLPFCVLAYAALAPFARAQGSHSPAMSGMHHGHKGMAMQHAMPTGMSGMEALKGLSGKKFNIAFMSQMIAHHRDAIDMAQQTLKLTKLAEVHKEAQMVVTGQKREIAKMTAWLQKWYGVKPSAEQAVKPLPKSLRGRLTWTFVACYTLRSVEARCCASPSIQYLPQSHSDGHNVVPVLSQRSLYGSSA